MWEIFLALNVAFSIFWLLISFQKSPLYCLFCYVQSLITTKKGPLKVDIIKCKTIHSRLLLIAVLQSKSWRWVIKNRNKIVRWNKKVTLYAIFHWPKMIILLYICFILNCQVTFFLSHKCRICNILDIFSQIFLKQSKNSINFNLYQQQH